ncbi:MAG TPA: methyltransferase domain-containing protein [Jatrophihabitans sp.]|nr:methyltransferase domain-containing protein [Jatrophihabitans sp.]
MLQPALTLTGERTLPGIVSENYWFRRHQAAYAFLAGRWTGAPPPRAGGTATLLEVGAGEGYGAAALAPLFDRAIALDYDAAAVRHLQRHYPHLTGCQANLAALPIRRGSVSALVSLQVIEHVWFPEQFLAECRRVLAPDGQLVLSTPNRTTFSPGLGRAQRPVNPFHVREFDADELLKLVTGAGFEVVDALGVHTSLPDHEELVAAQLRCEPDRWPAALTGAVAAVRVEDFSVRADAVATSLDLMLVARPGHRA